MPACSKCRSPSLINIPYSGADLCGPHFVEFVRKRAGREMRLQGLVPRDGTAVAAVSGGKDSAAMLHIVKGLLEVRRDAVLRAVLVDEGIDGYRPATIRSARALCADLNVPLAVVSFRERFGRTLDAMWAAYAGGNGPEDADGGTRREGVSPPDDGGPGPATARALSPCGMCGVLRRRCLNDAARGMGADVLFTGHNLDDTAQSVAMNVFGGELDRLVRMGPHPPDRVQEGLVPRRMPIRTVPEKETYLYCHLEGLPFDDGVCPYAETATRGRFRDLVDDFEGEVPGTRHRLLNTGDRMRELLLGAPSGDGIGRCGGCGEPSSGKLCKVCSLLRELGLDGHVGTRK